MTKILDKPCFVIFFLAQAFLLLGSVHSSILLSLFVNFDMLESTYRFQTLMMIPVTIRYNLESVETPKSP